MIPVFADVMWAPWDDDFFKSHMDAFTEDDRYYLVNGSQGYVRFYDAPGRLKQVNALENGEKVFVWYTIKYHGDIWALVMFDTKGHDIGYAKLKNFVRVYDYSDFAVEFADQIVDSIEEAPELRSSYTAWDYPHSVNHAYLIQRQTLEHWGISAYYTDEDGLLWGFCGGTYTNVWICFFEPTIISDISVREIDYGLIPPQPAPPLWQSMEFWLPVLLVLGVAAVTVVLLIWFKKRKKA